MYLRIHAKRLAEIVARNRFAIVHLVTVDQALSFAVFVEQMQRGGEVNTSDIVLPQIFLVLLEPIAQIQNVVRRDDTFAC